MNTFNPTAPQLPAANTDAICAMAAPSSNQKSWTVAQINWTYDATPTAGKLLIQWTHNSVAYTETYDIPVAGQGYITWSYHRVFPPGVAVTVTLKAGGSAVSGKVYVQAWTG